MAFAPVVASGAAMAQDMSWTGWRVGADLGAVQLKSTRSDRDDHWVACDTHTNRKSGTVYGVTVGHDWQINQAPVGTQFDYLFGSVKKTSDPFATVDQTDNLTSIAMLRGRGGYIFDKALLFATLGAAKPSIQHKWTVAGDPPGQLVFQERQDPPRLRCGCGMPLH